MIRLARFRAPGWFGLRVGRWYWVLRDERRHPLRFSERNRIGTRRLVKIGPWQFWVRGPINTELHP